MASPAQGPAKSAEGPQSPHSAARSTRSKQVVCTACRQSKVRCISTGAGDCARCSRLGLECTRDSNYKRQSKSRKIAELEKQVHLLTSAFNVAGAGAGAEASTSPSYTQRPLPSATSPSNIQSPHSESLSQAAGRTASHEASYAQSTPSNPIDPWLEFQGHMPRRAGKTLDSGFASCSGTEAMDGARPPATVGRSLKSVHLSPAQIDTLFQIFFDCYHPFLPFLESSRSPDSFYDAGGPLFWAIIGVAARRYQDDFTLFNILSEWVPKLVWSAISSPPCNGHTVAAIVLLATWPFPYQSSWNDTSMTLSSIAVSIAMQIGLHRPMNATDFRQDKAKTDPRARRMRTAVWAAANMVSEASTSQFGLLPTAPFDKTIELACQAGNVYTLSDELRIKLILHRYSHRSIQIIYSDLRQSMESYDSSSPPTDQPGFILTWERNLSTLNSELDMIEAENEQFFTDHDRILVAITRLYIHIMYFFDPSQSESRKHGVLKAYNSAVHLITLMINADASSSLLSYTPAQHLRMFGIAVLVLLKVLRSSYSSDVDFDAGKALCNEAVITGRKMVIGSNDSTGKMAKMIAQIWHSSNTDVLNEPPELLVKSRLGASIRYDFIWTWRQEFGGVPNAYPSSSKSVTTETPPANEDLMANIFQDASFVNLDFLNDPDWMDVLGDVGLSY